MGRVKSHTGTMRNRHWPIFVGLSPTAPLSRMTTRSILPASFVLAMAFPATAQQAPFTCSTHGLQHLSRFLDGHPERVQRIHDDEAQLEQETAAFSNGFDPRGGGNTYVIPVVFHIIHNGGVENISDDQCRDAIRVLNDDYNKLNTDWDNVQPEFLDRVADVGITFRLAGLDPDGNCTTGITRTQSPLTNDGGQDMKDLIIWPRDRYLNVWVCAYAQGAAGYTQTPGMVAGFWGEDSDGIVLLHNYTGAIGTSEPFRSRTLTHEVGHWINLSHCWGPTNEPGLDENCDVDDNVSDTPNTEGWTSCNLNGATCGSPKDNVENYMEYSYCSKMFTNGQKTRMLAALNSNTASRNNLWTANNLALTGTTEDQPLCAAAFLVDQQVVCGGSPVQFTDQSYHNPTNWNWSFPGGSPATSTEENPVVTYDAPGSYTVELTVGNGNSSVSTTQQAAVVVLSEPGAPLPWSESFEGMGSTLDPSQWMVENPGNDQYTFGLSEAAGYNSSHSVRMRNHGSTGGATDELLGPTLDLSGQDAVTLTFRYAFARRNGDNDDRLRFYVSNNCGDSWQLRKQFYGNSNLATVPDQNGVFTPGNADQWQLGSITNILPNYLVNNFRFKFAFESDAGNDLWIDDINIMGPVGINEASTMGSGLTVVPNPASDVAFVELDLPRATEARIDLLDMTGRTVSTVRSGAIGAGGHRIELPVRNLQVGCYFVRLQRDGRTEVARLIVR